MLLWQHLLAQYKDLLLFTKVELWQSFVGAPPSVVAILAAILLLHLQGHARILNVFLD